MSNNTKTKVKEVKFVSKRKKSRFFDIFISKILKQLGGGITANAKQQLNSALCHIAKSISKKALSLVQSAHRRTISDKEIGGAIKILFIGDMLNNCITEGEQAVIRFRTNENDKNTSRQDKAGIIFPPSLTEKFLRNFDFNNIMVTKYAPVYLAAVLEYIAHDILSISYDLTQENDRKRITIRELELTIKTDIELVTIFNKLNIQFLGGGVVPSIHSSLLKRRKPRKNEKKAPRRGQRRYRPGTVAIREIKKYQKMSNCNIFPKQPFEKYIRTLLNDDSINSTETVHKISKDVFAILQYYIEQFAVELLRNAGSASIHANRIKLMPSDIIFVCKLLNIYSNELAPYESLESPIQNREEGDGALLIDMFTEDVYDVDVDVDVDVDSVNGIDENDNSV